MNYRYDYTKCEQCGGLGCHRCGCPASYDPTDKHWITCTCGNNVFLLPFSNYMVDDWGGCHVYNTCGDCHLEDPTKLLAKVIEIFGKHTTDDRDHTRTIIPDESGSLPEPEPPKPKQRNWFFKLAEMWRLLSTTNW